MSTHNKIQKRGIFRGYKAFDRDLCCKGFQFEIGGTYVESRATLCSYGFHFCEDPANIEDYYDWKKYKNRCMRFAEVEAVDPITDGHKSVTKQIKIIREIPRAEFVRLAFHIPPGKRLSELEMLYE